MAIASSMTERALINACLENKRLAQRDLYEKYCNGMYTVAFRITNDQELAADVLQEAFIKVFRSLHTFRQESTLGAWIKTIVVRTALSKIKKEPQFDSLEHYQPSGYIDWGEYLEADYLEQAIRMLPDGYRTVFILIEVEGYSHKEVAELLNISIGTSKSQLFYAKKKLRLYITKLLNA